MIAIGFSTRSMWLSDLIRKITHSRFSHTWIKYNHPLYQADIVVEAGLTGIVEAEYNSYKSQITDIVQLIPPAGVSLEVGMTAIGLTLASKYDYGSLIGRLWTIVGSWIGRKWKNPLRNTKKDCCVENVYRLLQANGLYLDVDPEQESPESLYERLIKDHWIMV